MVRLQAPAVLTSSFKLHTEASSSYYIEGVRKQRESKDRQRTAVKAIGPRHSSYRVIKTQPISAIIAFHFAQEKPRVSPDPSSSSEGAGHETNLT